MLVRIMVMNAWGSVCDNENIRKHVRASENNVNECLGKHT
jgi:hypothetical protein